MYLAAFQHAVRRFRAGVIEALTDRARGFSEYEAGDFLTATEHARQQLVEREAEEEVAEPRPTGTWGFTEDELSLLGLRPGDKLGGGVVGPAIHSAVSVFRPTTPAASATAAPTSAGTPAAEVNSPAAGVTPATPAVGLPSWRPSHPTQTVYRRPGFMYGTPIPASLCATEGEPCEPICGQCATANPAGLSAAAGDPAPPAGFNFAEWATPVIYDVLGGHVCSYDDGAAMYECGANSYPWRAHETFGDEQDWREHVAPLIAERLEAALNPQK
jgi:hypothetical protein